MRLASLLMVLCASSWPRATQTFGVSCGAFFARCPWLSQVDARRTRSGLQACSGTSKRENLVVHGQADAEVLKLLRTEVIETFDTQRYPFKEAVRAVLRLPDSQDLDAVHEISSWHTEANGNRVSAFQKAWNANRDQMDEEFERIYRAFIAEVEMWPSCCCADVLSAFWVHVPLMPDGHR
jgi:hypothetical protein